MRLFLQETHRSIYKLLSASVGNALARGKLESVAVSCWVAQSRAQRTTVFIICHRPTRFAYVIVCSMRSESFPLDPRTTTISLADSILFISEKVQHQIFLT